MHIDLEPAIFRAADLIDQADGVLITAGAGMGVDSGLPDFRGGEGFWRAYPALAKAKLRFESIASPQTFEDDPTLAWGFYGHRLNLYRNTVPHTGFHVLREIGRSLPKGAFVLTTNVDGQFQRAGFAESEIVEAHGSIHHLQCMNGCAGDIWSADKFIPEIDGEQCRLLTAPPRCPHCDSLARPNILMFGDWGWLQFRERIQDYALRKWMTNIERLVVIEVGAGTAIPTARIAGQAAKAPMIRINLREASVPHQRDVSLPMGAKHALCAIANSLGIPTE